VQDRPVMREHEAHVILQTALEEGRAAELLECLFAGGACSYDSLHDTLVLIPANPMIV
jgi:hypothetical protein